jgi:hypothetical protein
MNKPELEVAILKSQPEKQELKCFFAAIFYICEVLFYPPIILIYYLLVLIFSSVLLTIIGALLCVLIPFFPFFLFCCFCQNGRPIASMLCGLSFMGVLFIIIGALYLAFSPIVAVIYFFWTYVLIFTGKVSPYFTMGDNWNTMTVYLNKNKDYVMKMYEEKKGNFSTNTKLTTSTLKV